MRDAIVYIRMTSELKEYLENRAREKGLNVSTFARTLLMDWYREETGWDASSPQQSPQP